MHRFRDFFRDCKGASAMEYGLMCSLICIAMVAALANVSSGLSVTFGRISNAFTL